MDPRNLTTVEAMVSALSAYQSEELDVSNSLNERIRDRTSVLQTMHKMESMLPVLDRIEGEGVALESVIADTALTADRVSRKVKALDEEMRRVKEAGDRVAQVMELKVMNAVLRWLDYS